jgi:flagellar biosynthesis/type III secretory pathway chaperone
MAQFENISQDLLAKVARSSVDQKTNICTFLSQYDPQSEWNLVSLWQQVEHLISNCRKKNNINGKIISLQFRHTQQALTILRHGEQGSESCYTPSGTRMPTISSRILGKV